MFALFHYVAETFLPGFVGFPDRLVNLSRRWVVRAVYAQDTLLVRCFNQMLSTKLVLVGPFHILKLGHPLDPLLLLGTPVLMVGIRGNCFVLVEVRESLSFGWETILNQFFNLGSFLLGLSVQETFDCIISLLVCEAEEFSLIGSREELGHLRRMLPSDRPERGSRPGPPRTDPDRILELQRVGPLRRCSSDCGALTTTNRLLSKMKR